MSYEYGEHRGWNAQLNDADDMKNIVAENLLDSTVLLCSLNVLTQLLHYMQ